MPKTPTPQPRASSKPRASKSAKSAKGVDPISPPDLPETVVPKGRKLQAVVNAVKTPPMTRPSVVKPLHTVAPSQVRVFQAYSEAWQRELLDPAFTAMDVKKVDPHGQDLAIWTQLQAAPAAKDAVLWGVVSWRFAEHTGMTGAEWLQLMAAQPGADVYFSSTDSEHEGTFHNAWLQAETVYPRFLEVAKAFLQAAGLPVTELHVITASANASSGNLLVATPAFWASYLPWLRALLVRADKHMPPALRDLMHAPIAGMERGAAGPVSYLPLLIERLLPFYLRTEGHALKTVKVALPEREAALNVHQKLLREMKDLAHRTQSMWLAACWINYRNLYFSQTQRKPWIHKYLRVVSPAEVRFG